MLDQQTQAYYPSEIERQTPLAAARGRDFRTSAGVTFASCDLDHWQVNLTPSGPEQEVR